MKIWLNIQRADGSTDRRRVSPSDTAARASGSCPGCDARPFLVQGSDKRPHDRNTYVANGRCVACHDPVGYIYARVDTIFGLEEDAAVGARARVY